MKYEGREIRALFQKALPIVRNVSACFLGEIPEPTLHYTFETEEIWYCEWSPEGADRRIVLKMLGISK
jgi:hypothetical protein